MRSLVTKQENAARSDIPRARVVTIPDASHFAYLSKEPEVLRDVQAFIARL